MALFRPYEQGKRDQSENSEATAEATTGVRQPHNDTTSERASTGATAVGSRRRSSGATAVTASTPTSTPAPSVSITQTPKPAARGPRVKQGPTPSRREAESARMERLHPTLTKKEQKAQSREHERLDRVRRLDAVENSPGRVLVRDFIDARWTLLEFMMPAAILLMAVTLASQMFSPRLANGLTIAMYVMFLAGIINTLVIWRSFKRELEQRHPGTPTRGLLIYMANRGIWIRRFRRPGPRLNRGDRY